MIQELQDYAAALADYDRAIALNPELAQAYSNRGLTYHHMQDYAAALADYDRAIALNPQDATAYYNTACAYALQNQIEKACTWLQKAIKMDEKYRQMARTDADFDPIREAPCLRALLANGEEAAAT